MATSSFLRRPQGSISIVSWNINGIKTKIEKKNVETFLSKYDIICLNEIRTCLPLFFPGYASYKNSDKQNSNRGGTCVFVRLCLNKYLFDVDFSCTDQIWFKLKIAPGVLFGSCYVPPSESEYFDYTQICNIQEKVKHNDCSNGCVIIGDVNARFGCSVRELQGIVDMAGISYPVIPDPVPTPNDNAKALLGICAEEELLVVNNLQNMNSHYLSKKTYCKGSEWISELDICIVSKGLLSLIESFDVVRDNSLPSDHAPISVTLQPPSPCLETLKLRSFELVNMVQRLTLLIW